MLDDDNKEEKVCAIQKMKSCVEHTKFQEN